MKVYTIPIADERSQKLSVTLGKQEVDIALTMRLGKLYIDVKANRVEAAREKSVRFLR